MKYIIIVALIFLSAISQARDNFYLEQSGNGVLAALTLTAFSSTFYKQDKNGRNQFYKSFFANTGSTFALKELVHKQRPDESGNDSFPSGHTSIAFQSAAFMQKRYGIEYGLPAYLAAAYTGWTRIAAEKHDEIDVISGMALGIGWSLLFTKEDSRYSVMPITDGHTHSILLTLRY